MIAELILEEEGIVFRCNANVGVDISINELIVIIMPYVGGGSTIPRDLAIPGRELKGIYFAMDFLKQQNKRVPGKEVEDEDIFATGKM